MRSTSIRLAVGALFLATAATAAGCVRSHVGPSFASPKGAVAVYRSDIPPQPCSVPTHRAAVVAQAPRPATAPAPYVSTSSASGSMPVPAGMAVRAVNATCPVMLGNPVDPGVTCLFQGRIVAFSDVGARSRWDTDPSRYAANLPGFASGTSSDAHGGSSSARIVSGPSASGAPIGSDSRGALPNPGRVPFAAVAHPAAFPAKRLTSAIAAPVPFVGSPDGDDDEAPAACEGDEECPGGNCRLPGR